MKRKKLGIVLLLLILLTGCFGINGGTEMDDQTAILMATGDIMYHGPQLKSAEQADGSYDFSENFEEMQGEIGKADIVAGNYESVCIPGAKATGYPYFNSPVDTIRDLKNSGFNVLSTINNHCLDQKEEGLNSTIDVMDDVGVSHFGTYKDGKRNYLIKDVRGIKIGFLGYSEFYNEDPFMLNSQKSVSTLDPTAVKADIYALRGMGADFIVIYPHWGVEYEAEPLQKHIDLAHDMLDWGADLVLGSHPHVLQKIETIRKHGEEKFIIYSMGNCISNQQQPEMEGRPIGDTEVGIFLKFEINKKDGDTRLAAVEAIPTWVNRHREDDGRNSYKVTKLSDYREGERLSGTLDSQRLDRTRALEDWAWKRIDFPEGMQVFEVAE